MTFKETLDVHLNSIRKKDLATFLSTLHEGENIICIEPDGKLVKDYAEFRQNHVEWFADTMWTIDFEIKDLREGNEYGIATLLYHYVDPSHDFRTWLSLLFERREGRWGLVHDQNTPLRAP